MYKPSFHDALHAGRLFGLLMIGALALLVMLESPKPAVGAQTAETRTDPAIRPEFREPVTLTSKEGVLEVRLTARQGQATLDTVATPVQNFLLFDYEVIRGTASDGQEVGRQSLSGADSAGISRRKADRPFRERPHRPDHPGLLQSAVHAQGSVRSDLPGADDLVTDQSPHPRSSHQSEGKCRQRVAAHPSRHVQHLHLRHSQEHAAGSVLVSQSSSWAHFGAGLYGSRRSACDRTNGRQPAARHGEKHSHPEHGASVQLRL